MRSRAGDFAVNLAASVVFHALITGAVGGLVSVLIAAFTGAPIWAIVFAGLFAGVLTLEAIHALRARRSDRPEPKTRHEPTRAAPRATTHVDDDDPWTANLARSLAAQRDVVRQHYAEMEKIIGPRPGSQAVSLGASVEAETILYRGRVIDPDSGASVVGVYVTADREQTRTAWTDEQGVFTLSLPRGRVWKLLLIHPGYAPTFVTARDDQSDLAIQLRRAAQ